MLYPTKFFIAAAIIAVQALPSKALLEDKGYAGLFASVLLYQGIAGKINDITRIKSVMGDRVTWRESKSGNGREVFYQSEQSLMDHERAEALEFSVVLSDRSDRSTGTATDDILTRAIMAFNTREVCYDAPALSMDLHKRFESYADKIDVYSKAYIINSSRFSKMVVAVTVLDGSQQCISQFSIIEYKLPNNQQSQ